MTWQWPVEGVVSQGFGPSGLSVEGPAYADLSQGIAHDPGARSFPNAKYYPHFHAALDIAAPEGTPFVAPQDATILDAQFGAIGDGSWAMGGGWFIRAQVNEDTMWLGAHFSKLLVEPGDFVRQGQRVALVGHTGIATGDHTHFWIRHGPAPYYDPGAFFFDPRLILPGGRLARDERFAPPSLPDTSTSEPIVDGDPNPMKFRSYAGQDVRKTVRAGRPIRSGWSVGSDVVQRPDHDRTLPVIGRIPKAKLPAAEQQYGDVFLMPLYTGGGHSIGYVKRQDLKS